MAGGSGGNGLRIRSGDDGGVLLTGTFFPALLLFVLHPSEGSERGVVPTFGQRGGTRLPWGDVGSFEARPRPQGAEPRWAHPRAEVPPFPAGMASRVLNCPPGSVCKILLCASLAFLLIRDESDGFSECAGVSWLSVTFVLPFSSQTALLPFIPRCIPDQRDFNLFILGEELNRGELPGWESSSCSHPDKLCAADWGQAFLSTPRPLCPGAAGVPKGLTPKLSLTGGLSSPGTSPPSLRDALPSSSPARIPPTGGRCPPHSTPSHSSATHPMGERCHWMPCPGWGGLGAHPQPWAEPATGWWRWWVPPGCPLGDRGKYSSPRWRHRGGQTRWCHGLGGDDGEWG